MKLLAIQDAVITVNVGTKENPVPHVINIRKNRTYSTSDAAIACAVDQGEHDWLFEVIEEWSPPAQPAVEQASAAPGEGRNVTPPTQ